MTREFRVGENIKEESKAPKSNEQQIRNRIEKELEKVGWPGHPPSQIVDRFFNLENAGFNFDSLMIIEGIEEVLKLLKDSFKLKPIEKKRLILATYLSDIGKAYTPEIAKLFSVEGITDRETVTVGDIVNLHFKKENLDNKMENSLKDVKVNFKMTMKEFHDKHAFWTKYILDWFPNLLDKKIKTIAASHHINAGIDPCNISNVDGSFKIDNEIKFSIFLLMAMDKYQASLVRGRKTHKEAIESLNEELKPFDGDNIKDMIVRAIEQLGNDDDSIFPKGELKAAREKRRKKLLLQNK